MRTRWVELALVTTAVGLGAFLRLYTFGEFPADGVIFGEEGINGRIAYQILQGDRPLEYPLTRYVSALGFLFFGENTTGLRFPYVLAGIITIVPFYLLARELVRPPAALFATTLLAAAALLIEPTLAMQARILAMVLFFYLLVRGVRTESAISLIGAGFLAGLLSYEWEAFKLVPLVAVAFLAVMAVKGLMWPWPQNLPALLQRTRQRIQSRWRLALALFGSAAVVAIPLAVAQLRGEGIYLRSLERHVSGAHAANPGLLADGWTDHLKWTAELFIPFGPRTFPDSPITTGLPLLDLVTGTLLAFGVLWAIVTLYKPYRALFLGYFLIGMVGTALVAEPFWGWRFIPLLPAGLMLVAFLVDDVAATAERLAPGATASYALPALVAAAAAYAFGSNSHALLGTIVDDPELPRVYSGNRPERGYALCDFIRKAGPNAFAYILHDDQRVGAFSGTADTVNDQLHAFGDLAWVCHGLRGVPVAAPEEVWPLDPAPPLQSGAAVLAFITKPEAVDGIAAAVRQAMPAKGQPDLALNKPSANGVFTLVGYQFSLAEIRALQGLAARYEGVDGRLLEERVEDVAFLRWADVQTLALPFTVRWSGLVYLSRPARASLVATSDDQAEVLIEGRPSFSNMGGTPALFPMELLPGWHPVEITVIKKAPGGGFSLGWLDEQGEHVGTVTREHLFPLASLRGWRHRRTLASEGAPLETPVTERFDFAPHLASRLSTQVRAVVLDIAPAPAVDQVRVLREEWSALWRVPEEREYLLKATAGSAAVVVTLDGVPVIDLPAQEGAQPSGEARMRVPAGEHRVEVVQTPDLGQWTGAMLAISDPADPAFTPDVRPF